MRVKNSTLALVNADRWKQVEDCYHAAMERPVPERGVFLTQACANDPELRREVESLLAQGPADELLASSPWGQITPADETGTFEPAALSAGSMMAEYRITGRLGAGGMGEVYRATDTKLQREVALKVLAQGFAQNSVWISRFRREARVLASLNHPHIAAIYGLEESGGVRAIAMELVEGPTLAERVARGRIPIPEALVVARQIAEALEYAHEKGIVHRDLKPANVKLRPDGVVKVLDFGLAKAIETKEAPAETATHAGVIMGTPAYMAPEQAAGLPVDRRADIWAFGVVLFEMLAGRKIYSRKTTLETLAAVAKDEAPWNELPVETPAAILWLLRRCLDRDPKRRLRDIGEARIAIENVGKEPKAAVSAAATTSPSGTLPWIAAGVMTAVAAVVLWAPWRTEKPGDRPLVRLDVDLGADVSLPEPTTTVTISPDGVAISPDGTRLVYPSGTPEKLFTRGLDQAKATELPGTQEASAPFFSPDGQWVGFHSNGRLNKIAVSGGVVVPIGDVGANFAGASWGEDGSVFVSNNFQRGLLRIPAGGGPPESVAGLGNGEIGLTNPQILPGGKAILFSVVKALGLDGGTIEVLTLADRHRKVVARGGRFARYLATSSGIGHLVYVNSGTLFAIAFDPAKLETRSTAVPVLDDLSTGSGRFDFSSAPSGHGTLVYRRTSGGGTRMLTLQWVGPTGKVEPLRAKPGLYMSPSVSRDGKRVALTAYEGGSPDVWIYDMQRDAMTRLTFGGATYRWSAWSPYAQYLVFTSDGNGIFQARADGTSQPQALLQDRPFQFPCSFTPDGKRLVYFEAAGNYQIWTVPLEDTGGRLKAGKPEQFLKSSFNDVYPSFSPDGRWLAYSSDESGKYEVYVRAFPSPSSGQGGKWQISNSGGTWPRWSRSGHEIVYQSGERIMTVSYIVNGDTFVAETPRLWIAKLGGAQWDLVPNGKGVLVLTPVESAEAPRQEHEVVFLINFFDELRRRVPAKN